MAESELNSTTLGRKSRWNHPPTRSIRVPNKFAPLLLEIAKILDNNESFEVLEGYLLNTYFFNDEQSDYVLEEFEMATYFGVQSLYYITHIDNLLSILDEGILSHSLVLRKKINYQAIYNPSVVNRRSSKIIQDGKKLWDFANLYFQPRNAMLYSLVRNYNDQEFVIISIKNSILRSSGVHITDGNAANNSTIFLTSDNINKDFFTDLTNQIRLQWWNPNDDSKRRIMAECLVPDKVKPNYFQSLLVPTPSSVQRVESIREKSRHFSGGKLPIVVEPYKFFRPDKQIQLKNNLSLAQGDMFFSRSQTLTISVNCVGVMGKGLAATAKYRFPDVYVKYQDLCKEKRLDYCSPFLYKKKTSIFDVLGDQSLIDDAVNDHTYETWFLLFPTKKHWKNKSSLQGIEQGLKWLLNNYKQEGIQSISLPALGCGQGQLTWEVVGPLMCKYLSYMDIPTIVYLPAETNIESQYLSKEFLLPQ